MHISNPGTTQSAIDQLTHQPRLAMYRQLPNQLTLLRLILASVFFVVLNQYRYAIEPRANMALVLAIIIFILAAISDLLDGYLARRWNVESNFGRLMDPFCDKVLIIGAFVYLAGPRFVNPNAVAVGSFFNMISGVYPWMVAVILSRELLVTSFRGASEGAGVQFGASFFGKLKMIIQSVCIPVILLIIYLDPSAEGHHWLAWIRDALVYATVAVTAISILPYIGRAAGLLKT